MDWLVEEVVAEPNIEPDWQTTLPANSRGGAAPHLLAGASNLKYIHDNHNITSTSHKLTSTPKPDGEGQGGPDVKVGGQVGDGTEYEDTNTSMCGGQNIRIVNYVREVRLHGWK